MGNRGGYTSQRVAQLRKLAMPPTGMDKRAIHDDMTIVVSYSHVSSEKTYCFAYPSFQVFLSYGNRITGKVGRKN